MSQAAALGRIARVSAVPFIATSFLGAALIFLVQPMFARMATPLLGGAPSVWNVSLVCFQAALLGGYAYAHALSRIQSVRTQVLIHAVVLAAGFACLPMRMSGLMGEPDANNPVFWLLGTFAISIAPPFAALSATAPLIQHWYAKSGLPDAADPYHLYAASNIGSLVGLAAYPLLIEPFSPIATQSGGWMIGYAFLAAVLLYAGWSIGLGRKPQGVTHITAEGQPAEVAPARPITWKQRAIWLALSFAPSSLLVGVTSHITTDVAAAPFLWAPPLMIYLLTFVLAFAKKPLIPHEIVLTLSPLAAGFAIYMMSGTAPGILFLTMGSDLFALFMIALACHGALNLSRPEARHLTEFYLLMSLGGVLGGGFNALIAPVIFDGVVEYPLMLVASLLLLSLGQAKMSRVTIILLAASAVTLVIAIAIKAAGIAATPVICLGLMAPSLAAIIISRRAPLGAAIALALAAPIGWILSPISATWADRSFFGVVKVVDKPEEHKRMMLHGTTLHGMQSTAGETLRPLTYYAPETPIGQAFRTFSDAQRVGIVGLGIGSTACYRKPGQEWTFFEIDPLVVQVATDPKRFTFMSSCAGASPIEVGDARVTLANSSKGYDLLLLDAFSSDTVPTHLLTKEAMDLYMSRIGDKGVLLIHISNRHLSLAPVVARVVEASGGKALFQRFRPTQAVASKGASPSDVVMISRSQAQLDRARAAGQWTGLKSDGGRPWTDDYSNIIGAMIDHAREAGREQ